MKINQVEELVGITKKNIRFYEEQGLISPERNLENGYRDYSIKDVELLNKIKLLRKLDVPIEDIRKLNEGTLSLQDCMESHIRKMSHKQKELDVVKEMCQLIANSESDVSVLDATKYLEDMQQLEEGGQIFMDVEKYDVRKSKRGPIVAAVSCVVFFTIMIAIMLYMSSTDKETPFLLIALFVAVFVVLIVGVLLALKQRLKEIEGGEINEARKY